jgi:hypothetical protein
MATQLEANGHRVDTEFFKVRPFLYSDRRPYNKPEKELDISSASVG